MLAPRLRLAAPGLRRFAQLRRALNDADHPTPEQTPESRRKKRILILSPEQTKDKTLASYVAGLKRGRPARTPPNILRLLADDALEPALHSLSGIDKFRKDVEQGRASAAALAKAFTKDQLCAYVAQHAEPRNSWRKSKLANYIVANIWKQAQPAVSALYLRVSIPLSRQEMFYLLSQQGQLLRFVQLMVSSVDFDTKKNELVLVGTESQIENARINFASRLDAAYREQFDLTAVQQLYRQKFGKFTIEELGKLIEVYFHHLDGNKYELSALNASQVKRIKRLLVWHLDYNLHRRRHLHLPSLDNTAVVPFLNDYCLPWKSRSKLHFLLVENGSNGPSATLQKELERFSPEKLAKIDFDVDDIGQAKKPVVDETYELLESLGLLKEDLDPKVEEPEKAEEVVVEPESTDLAKTKITISAEQKDKIYKELVDFDYRKSLRGVEDARLEKPIFTVTLGRVLFEANKEKGVILPQPPAPASMSQNYDFNTNVPLAYDHALSRVVVADEAGDLSEDPHVYSLQFKFLPSPFDQANLDEQMKYPPIEMWVQLNERSTPDLETLQMVTVEAENDSYVCLPSARCDMKVSCQVTGNVLSSQEPAAEAELQESNIEHMLAATSTKYPGLSGQKGVQAFLEALQLDFSGKSRTSIAPFVDVVIAGKPVQYCFVSLCYRKEMTMDTDAGKTVQLSVVDGGTLGGRRAELRFVGDYAAGLDRANFDELVDHAAEFVSDL